MKKTIFKDNIEIKDPYSIYSIFTRALVIYLYLKLYRQIKYSPYNLYLPFKVKFIAIYIHSYTSLIII